MGSCQTCMQDTTVDTRQLAGCPYAPLPPPRARALVQPWCGLGYRGDKPTVCPGHTTELPEVIEVVRAHRHWKVGAIGAVTVLPAPEALLQRIEVFEGACRELESWAMTPASKGGGAEG